jgi:ribonuclease inhibitor
MRVELDCRKMTDRKAAHAYLKQALALPDYYGNNLDALYDCLTDLPPTEIYLENLEEAGHFYPVIKHVMHSAKKEHRDIGKDVLRGK